MEKDTIQGPPKKRPGLCMLSYCAPLFKLWGWGGLSGPRTDGLGVSKHAYLKNSELWSCGSAAPIMSTGAGPGVPGLAGPPRGAEARLLSRHPVMSHFLLLLPYLQREGQLNREILKPPWKAVLLPRLEPHKGCRSGRGRDTLEAVVYSFPQSPKVLFPPLDGIHQPSALPSITKAPSKCFQMAFCVLGPLATLSVPGKVDVS